MTFESYINSKRNYILRVPINNPAYADDLAVTLNMHLKTVEEWIDGDINRPKMAEAMKFFGSRYSANGVIYRGTEKLIFDGKPASYTKKPSIAEGFAVAVAESHFFFKPKTVYIVKRNAPSSSLDLSKLLREYAEGDIPRSDEAEVICYNTPVGDRNITELSLVPEN